MLDFNNQSSSWTRWKHCVKPLTFFFMNATFHQDLPQCFTQVWLSIHMQEKMVKIKHWGSPIMRVRKPVQKKWLTLGPTEIAIQHWVHYLESMPRKKVLATSLALCIHIQVHSCQEKVGMEKEKQCLHWTTKHYWRHFPHANRKSMFELGTSAQIRLFYFYILFRGKIQSLWLSPSKQCLVIQNFLLVSAPPLQYHRHSGC